MQKTLWEVNGMSCGHCVAAVTKALKALPGMGNVAVDLERKTVTAEYDAAQCRPEAIAAAIEGQGYEVVRRLAE